MGRRHVPRTSQPPGFGSNHVEECAPHLVKDGMGGSLSHLKVSIIKTVDNLRSRKKTLKINKNEFWRTSWEKTSNKKTVTALEENFNSFLEYLTHIHGIPLWLLFIKAAIKYITPHLNSKRE